MPIKYGTGNFESKYITNLFSKNRVENGGENKKKSID
jgi:hypothetical protein